MTDLVVLCLPFYRGCEDLESLPDAVLEPLDVDPLCALGVLDVVRSGALESLRASPEVVLVVYADAVDRRSVVVAATLGARVRVESAAFSSYPSVTISVIPRSSSCSFVRSTSTVVNCGSGSGAQRFCT